MTNHRILSSFSHALLIAFSMFLASYSSLGLSQTLPELSDSASLVINTEQEKLLGQQIMLNVRSTQKFSDDVLLIDYFDRLTRKLAQYSPRDFGTPKTGVTIDPAINAFAVPGGYITVNTGLIQNTDNEAQLASVIAHEIGHQSQRHISRSIERQKQLTLPATAALIGGLILGGEAGKAAIVSTQAAVAADQLAYSRTFEREADATGMNILAAAGYDPAAMPAFFDKLEKQSRLYGGLVVEFLSTHPVSSDRIADSLSRASRLPPRLQADTAESPEQLDYQHAEARTFALYDEPVDVVIKRFEHQITDPKTDLLQKNALKYGLLVALIRQHSYAKAAVVLQQLRDEAPDMPLYKLVAAELAYASGDASIAISSTEALYKAYRPHPAYVDAYAKALFLNGQYTDAIRILRKTIRHQPQSMWAYELLARAYDANGQSLNAIFIKAQVLQSQGLFSRALALLKQQGSEPHSDKSAYLSASIDDLIRQIQARKKQLDDFDL